MGLFERIGLVAGNVALLIPVFALLIASAIMASYAAGKIKKFSDQSDQIQTVYKNINNIAILLWILSIGSIVFAFTLGLVIIPWLVTIPYFYGFIMILFSILNLVIAGYMFYSAVVIRASNDYKEGTDDAKGAFNNCMIIGGMMVAAGVFMIGYSIYSIHHYYKMGGITSDVALVGEYGGDIAAALGQVEIAAPLQAAGQAAQKSLTEQQLAQVAASKQQIAGLQKLGAQVMPAIQQGQYGQALGTLASQYTGLG